MTESVASGPDLSARDYQTRVRIAVAKTQGWTVRTTDEEDVPCFDIGEVVGLPPDWRERDILYAVGWGEEADAETADWTWLPNYLSDPAAWGALMEKEGISVVFTATGVQAWPRGGVLALSGESVPDAVANAALHKYGVTVDP